MLLNNVPSSLRMEWEFLNLRRDYEEQFPTDPFQHVEVGSDVLCSQLPISHVEVHSPFDPMIGNPIDDTFGNPFDDNPFGANPFNYDPFNNDNNVPPRDVVIDDTNDDCGTKQRKPRRPNAYPYKFFDVYEANWYKQFLRPEVRERTYDLSKRDRRNEFRCLFRVPLQKIDEYVDMFLDRGWITTSKHCRCPERLRVKAQLLIMGALNVLGHHTPFVALRSNTEICTSEHRVFFHHFLNMMYRNKDEYVYYPRNLDELERVMKRYSEVHLPGCGGSIDVVHLKWSACPAGDLNRCKGKEGYPTVGFEVITGFDRQILGISSIQFGTRNDQHIVKIDENVQRIRDGWYKTVKWQYFDEEGNVKHGTGVYLICDGGYLRWPILICPYRGSSVASREGYFSGNIESIRKDGELSGNT